MSPLKYPSSFSLSLFVCSTLSICCFFFPNCLLRFPSASCRSCCLNLYFFPYFHLLLLCLWHTASLFPAYFANMHLCLLFLVHPALVFPFTYLLCCTLLAKPCLPQMTPCFRLILTFRSFFHTSYYSRLIPPLSTGWAQLWHGPSQQASLVENYLWRSEGKMRRGPHFSQVRIMHIPFSVFWITRLFALL